MRCEAMEPAHSGRPCRADGRCQYAIDVGAEGIGACPAGRCIMPKPADHIASPECWCEPEVEHVDPETGVAVYVHRTRQ